MSDVLAQDTNPSLWPDPLEALAKSYSPKKIAEESDG